MKPVVGSASQLRAVGAELGSCLPAQARRPGAQGELARNGKPFVLPIKAGRGRSRGSGSSDGAASAQGRRSRRGQVQSHGLWPGRGMNHAVKGGRGVARQSSASAGPTARSPRRTQT